jgi:very-short-patch-repair endonuclease
MPEESAKVHRDSAIAGIAATQHGVLTSRQLQAVGLSTSAVGDRVAAGRLHRIHRGVYAVGHPNIGNEGRWMAAVLACGDGAVLSHRSAGELWGILPIGRGSSNSGEPPGPVHVTVSSDGGRNPRAGIRLHRSPRLSPADVTRRAGIPVTKPSRTLRDLRRSIQRNEFKAAVRQAEFVGLPLDERAPPDHTRSELEARFLAVCRRHRLPPPEVNVRVDDFVVDFLWRGEQLIVELDGWASHRTRSAFEADRARDARLKVCGYDVVRFTWHQVHGEAREVAAVIRALLRR